MDGKNIITLNNTALSHPYALAVDYGAQICTGVILDMTALRVQIQMAPTGKLSQIFRQILIPWSFLKETYTGQLVATRGSTQFL